MPRLTSGGAVLDLLPEIGGAVGRFTVDGIDILRAAVPGTRDPLETACFPAGALRQSYFEWRISFR